MIPINRTYAPIQAFVEELRRCGLTHAVTSPGSRNAPIALTLAAQDGVECLSVVDERSAGFAALGAAKATGRPVAVCCTSGTAAANLLPAVAEAHAARVPLLVLTADRPPELRDVGARQWIDQIGLYGSAAKWSVEVGSFEPSRETAVHFRALACRAYATADGACPGPVHLNFPLRDPLAPIEQEGLDPEEWRGRADGSPWVDVDSRVPVAEDEVIEELASELAAEPRGVIVAGPTRADFAPVVTDLARALGWPILGEPASGLRCGPHDRASIVAHYDLLLRVPELADELSPALALRVGDMPVCQPLHTWLSRVRQIVFDPDSIWNEPTRVAERLVQACPVNACERLAVAVEGRAASEGDWLARWRDADEQAAAAIEEMPDEFEGRAYGQIAASAPSGALVWSSSSMPIRDVEACLPQRDEPLRVVANSGANGIDGVVSSGLGAAWAGGQRTLVLIGDVALAHDAGGLLAAGRAGIELTILCIDNGGGSIFDYLPVADHADADRYEQHIATPAAADIAGLAQAAGMPHTLASSLADARTAAERAGIVEYRTDRTRNVELHRELVERVAQKLS